MAARGTEKDDRPAWSVSVGSRWERSLMADRGTGRAIALLGGELGWLRLELATGIPAGLTYSGWTGSLRGVLHSGYSRSLLRFYTPDVLGVYGVSTLRMFSESTRVLVEITNGFFF